AEEQAGLGTLELCSSTARLAAWRYTAAQGAAARRLESQWTLLLERRTKARSGKADGEVTATMPTVCPSCGALITSSDGVCTACAPVAPPPPVSSLYRLLAFAKPRSFMIGLGLALTFAGTAASLVPLYLTMPLINNVLVPRFNGQNVSPTL